MGERKLQLTAESGYAAFPPRLPEQPILYPVLNEQYAIEIAARWNTRDKNSVFKGFVTRFQVNDRSLTRYPVQTVGRSYHQELWIPAEELEEFNPHIIGPIQVIKEMGGPGTREVPRV